MGEKVIFCAHYYFPSSALDTVFGNRKGIKQTHNLDWSDINAGLCICFLSLVSIKS